MNDALKLFPAHSARQDSGDRQQFMSDWWDTFLLKAFGLAPLFKHEAFEAEMEWRLLLFGPPERSSLEFRTRYDTLVPFVALSIHETPKVIDANLVDSRPLLPVTRVPVTRVLVGPSPNSKLARVATQALLERYEYYQRYIEGSEIPYRTE